MRAYLRHFLLRRHSEDDTAHTSRHSRKGCPDIDTGAWQYIRPCAQQYVGKYQSCMVISGRLIVHAPVGNLTAIRGAHSINRLSTRRRRDARFAQGLRKHRPVLDAPTAVAGRLTPWRAHSAAQRCALSTMCGGATWPARRRLTRWRLRMRAHTLCW